MNANLEIHTSKGFTLVELLVVIAIIVLLVSMLLPTLNKARAAMVLVNCQSNLHQIGQGIQMYANEQRGYLIPPGGYYPDGTFEQYPHFHLSPELGRRGLLIWRGQDGSTPNAPPDGVPHGNYVGLSHLFVNGYVRNPLVFYCPADELLLNPAPEGGDVGYGQVRNWMQWGRSPTGFPTFPGANGTDYGWYAYTSYSYFHPQYTLPGFGPSNVAQVKVAKLHQLNRHRLGVLADHYNTSAPNGVQFSNNRWGTHRNKRQQRYNVLYSDGHVITFDQPKDVLYWTTNDTAADPNRPANRDLTLNWSVSKDFWLRTAGQ